MFFERKNLRIFIYGAVIDMRCGFEKLYYFTKVTMQQDINQGHLYLFFGKNRRRIKILFFDGTGLVQISKRIERGKFMSRLELGEISEITFLEFKQVFNGGLIVATSNLGKSVLSLVLLRKQVIGNSTDGS